MPGGFFLIVLLALLFLPAIPQDLTYHNFADQRELLGVPHFWNVVSNVPFVLIGAAGLVLLLRDGGFQHGRLFLDAREKWPYLIVFLGVFLTGFGSAYYHLAPNNETLLWDRLPMSIAFMALFAVILGERTRPQVGIVLLAPLLLFGVGSVFLWYFGGNAQGGGNLSPYGAVQFYPLAAIPFLLYVAPPRYTRGGDYLIALGWYLLAKVLEMGDHQVHHILGAVGGHPLKHVAAALGPLWLLQMILLRRPVGGN